MGIISIEHHRPHRGKIHMGKNMFIEIDNERFLTDILFDQTKLIPVESVEKDGKWITIEQAMDAPHMYIVDVAFNKCDGVAHGKHLKTFLEKVEVDERFPILITRPIVRVVYQTEHADGRVLRRYSDSCYLNQFQTGINNKTENNDELINGELILSFRGRMDSVIKEYSHDSRNIKVRITDISIGYPIAHLRLGRGEVLNNPIYHIGEDGHFFIHDEFIHDNTNIQSMVIIDSLEVTDVFDIVSNAVLKFRFSLYQSGFIVPTKEDDVLNRIKGNILQQDSYDRDIAYLREQNDILRVQMNSIFDEIRQMQTSMATLINKVDSLENRISSIEKNKSSEGNKKKSSLYDPDFREYHKDLSPFQP